MSSILLVEDREGLRRVYASFLRAQDYIVVEEESVEHALKALDATQFDLVLTDYMLPGANGLDLLRQLKEKDPECPLIVMTAFGEVKLAVEAIKAGAFDFLEKPVDLEYLKLVVERALNLRTLSMRRDINAGREDDGTHIVGQSAALAAALQLADRVAPSDANCLLLGESGVGKELFAQRIHAQSTRASGELVSINCASIPRDLVESELFGHERGAFTGAVTRKTGLVEAANGGTLFLDEIGELPLDIQPKLLRVIQTRQFYRVGGNRTCTSDVRILCATNRDLKQGSQEGWFREDLYYRLASFPIVIPPLRERVGDLEALAQYFLDRRGYAHRTISPELLSLFQSYPWPGNVRELENLLERAMILAGGKQLALTHFPADLIDAGSALSHNVPLDLHVSFKDNLRRAEKELERRLIIVQLKRFGGNREKAARALGYSVKTLYNKIKAYDLTEF